MSPYFRDNVLFISDTGTISCDPYHEDFLFFPSIPGELDQRSKVAHALTSFIATCIMAIFLVPYPMELIESLQYNQITPINIADS